MFINIIILCCFLGLFNLLNKQKKLIKTKKNYIFAYGSLLNYYVQKSLIGKALIWPKATLKKEFGYERYWFYSKKNGVTLGIIPSKTPKNINGIIIEVSDEELKKIDKYKIEESKHIKIRLNWNDIKCNEKYKNKNDNLFVYIIKNHKEKINITKKMPNLYAMTVMSGFAFYGDNYLNLFLKNTK